MNEDYSPYCKECGGCGEEGCCSPMMCTQSPNGDYCQTYLIDLQLGYLMDKYFMENIYNDLDEGQKHRYDAEWNRVYDELYGKK